jgi:hypothetical protein
MLKILGIIFVWTLVGAVVSGLLLGIQRDIEEWRRRDDRGEGKVGYWPVLLAMVVLAPIVIVWWTA